MRPSSGPIRRWLAELEDLLAIQRAASACAARPPGRRRGSPAWDRLVARVADEGVLSRLAPGGRIPDSLPARALGEVRQRLDELLRRVPAERAPAGPEIGRVLVERGVHVVEGRRNRRFEAHVNRAVHMLEHGWPDGARLVGTRVWRVVPVTAWATVSWSSAREPGVAYINVRSAPTVRLAEDLVHEATHMRIHEIESLHALVVPDAEEDHARSPRFYSPWRREWRPLRGLVHAVCTFTAGARFFERMLAASSATGPLRFGTARRLWLARRMLEERASVALSLRVLARARGAGLLTREGARVVRAAALEHRALATRAGACARELSETAAGRREIAKLERFSRTLSARPVRWSRDHVTET